MLKIGDIVNFHSLIGGPVTSEGHEITHILLQPNNFGCDVAWITGKSGCVALAALSNEEHPMQPLPKRPTRSQQRYLEYIESEYPDSFADFLGIDTVCEYVWRPSHHGGCGYQYVNRYKGLVGPVCRYKKDAKAGYKALLKARRDGERREKLAA